MTKVKNRKSGEVIEVPDNHWQEVLSRQGKYELVVDEAPVKKAPAKKKVARPRKEK